jgi:hypothetical protein
MSVKENVKDFWARFADESGNIVRALTDHEYEELQGCLEGLREMAMSAFGCSLFVEDAADMLELTLDPGPNKTSQYLAQYAVDHAPADIAKQWILNASLPPLSQKAVEAQVKIKDEVYGLADFHVFYKADNQSQTLACSVYCPGYSLIDNEENKREMSMYLLELALGQTCYEAYIGSVSDISEPEADSEFANLADFYEVVMTIVEKNGWKEYAKPLDIYSVYQPFQDFANDSLRKDMKIVFTTHPMLAEETLGEGKDVLLDLKAKDGEFGYIYYVNPFSGKDDALFRQELSKTLGAQMEAVGAGQVIGGAIGKSYSYIDWIVYDKEAFEKAFAQLKKQLEDKVELHYRSFDDSIVN